MRIRPLAVASLAALVLIALAALIGPAHATPYWGDEEVRAFLDRGLGQPAAPSAPQALPLPSLGRSLASPDRDPAYMDEFSRICAFLAIWQVNNPSSPDHGGIREGEHLPTIIQTDNTSEAIWVWTRYYELTGDDRYRPNILAAFTYSLRWPAYNEEGGSTASTGYYRMYNCGWAVRAEQKYRDVYGDHAYEAYSDSCAGYIRAHTLNRGTGNPFYDYVNPPVLSWAIGNLYDAGVHEGNQAWMDRAVAEARDKIKVWVQAEPALLGNETWAMAGGATMWGFIHSYLRANPDSTVTWLHRYKDRLDVYSNPPGDFTNAWNGWFALGHRAVGKALADPLHLAVHMALTDTLMFEDGDVDGGVPARPPDNDNMDQTWVSNYLAFMGLSDILGPASAVDLDATTPAAGAAWLAAAPNPFRGRTSVRVELARAGNVEMTIHDLSGRLVATGGGMRLYPAGTSTLWWDGGTLAGGRAPAGVYWARVRTDAGVATTRLVLER